MRKALLLTLVVGLTLANVGCVMVLDVKDMPYRKQVVEIDGELFIVDMKAHSVLKIDAAWMAESETIIEMDIEESDD